MARPRKLFYGEANAQFRPALERFAEKCRFDPLTGCILWIGGTNAGRGNTARYGAFWFEGSTWRAPRWAAIHIHGIPLGDRQAGHNCPSGPNTLCIQHIEAQTQLENLDELNNRLKVRANQPARDKQYWLFVSLGIEPEPPQQVIDPDAVPFHEPPEWFKPFMPKQENSDDCPF